MPLGVAPASKAAALTLPRFGVLVKQGLVREIALSTQQPDKVIQLFKNELATS
jgi:hypothetical protein